MGLFSSDSKSTTQNTDNRVVNDYANADMSTKTDNSISGFAANNSGSINVLDGGAFKLAERANDNVVSLAAGLGQYNSEIALGALNMGQSVLSDTALLIDGAGQRSLAGSMALNDSLNMAHNTNTDLAYGLAQLTGNAYSDAASQLTAQVDDNNDALNNGFKSMMQFAENFSRSDGSDLAKTNMKTIAVVMIGLAVLGLGVAYLSKGK